MPRFLPDGRHYLYFRAESEVRGVWIGTLDGPERRRLLDADAAAVFPRRIWRSCRTTRSSCSAGRIVYAGPGQDGFDLRQVPATGVGSDTVLYSGPDVQVRLDWSSDGRFVLFVNIGQSGSRLMALPVSGDDAPFEVARSRASGGSGVFSPDGTWVAFESDETGRVEVYLQPFPGPGPRRVISIGGGVAAGRPGTLLRCGRRTTDGRGAPRRSRRHHRAGLAGAALPRASTTR